MEAEVGKTSLTQADEIRSLALLVSLRCTLHTHDISGLGHISLPVCHSLLPESHFCTFLAYTCLVHWHGCHIPHGDTYSLKKTKTFNGSVTVNCEISIYKSTVKSLYTTSQLWSLSIQDNCEVLYIHKSTVKSLYTSQLWSLYIQVNCEVSIYKSQGLFYKIFVNCQYVYTVQYKLATFHMFLYMKKTSNYKIANYKIAYLFLHHQTIKMKWKQKSSVFWLCNERTRVAETVSVGSSRVCMRVCVCVCMCVCVCACVCMCLYVCVQYTCKYNDIVHKSNQKKYTVVLAHPMSYLINVIDYAHSEKNTYVILNK